MIPILYPANETDFISNGLGRLPDATRCLVTEERNGQYELEMDYPISGLHYGDIAEDRILLVTHDDTGDKQPFRIYKIDRPLNGIVTVHAQHISYQLSKVVVMPFTAANCPAALQGMVSHAVGECPFQVWTDKTTEASFKLTAPASFRSILGGTSGSILDTFGTAEYEWDKYTVKLHAARGQDSGVTIRYGKNLTELRKVTDTSNVWTGIVPYWAGTDETQGEQVVTLPEEVIWADNREFFPNDTVVSLDFTSSFQSAPTVEQLRARAEAYVAANAKTSVPASIDISFVALWQTEEYQNVAPLQRLRLCDTVTVSYPALGVENKAKIVKTVYNVLLDRYDEMTIGDVRANLGDTIAEAAEEAIRDLPTVTSMQQAIAWATNLLTGGLGGHVVINRNANGEPNEILIMDTANINTAVNVLRINLNGIGFSSTGYNGPFTSAWTLDGRFVADFIQSGAINASLITAGALDADVITTGAITDAAGNTTWDLDNSTFTTNAFDATFGSLNTSIGTLNTQVGTLNTQVGTLNVTIGNKADSASIIATINSSNEGLTINTGKLNLNGYVTFTNLATDGQCTIDGGNITAGSITANEIHGKTITADEIVNGSISNLLMAQNSVDTAQICNYAVDTAQLALGAVDTNQLAANAVTAAKCNVSDLFAQNITATGVIDFNNGRYQITTNASGEVLIKSNGGKLTLNSYYLTEILGGDTGISIGSSGTNSVSGVRFNGYVSFANASSIDWGSNAPVAVFG